MKNLKSLLKEYVPSSDVPLGGGRKKIQKENLKKALLILSRKSKSFFYWGFTMLIVLFIVALFLIWFLHQRPELIAGVFGATGLGLTGIITTMFSHWKEKTRADMLLTLLDGVDDEETIKTVVATLASKL